MADVFDDDDAGAGGRPAGPIDGPFFKGCADEDVGRGGEAGPEEGPIEGPIDGPFFFVDSPSSADGGREGPMDGGPQTPTGGRLAPLATLGAAVVVSVCMYVLV